MNEIDYIYERLEGNMDVENYFSLHKIKSSRILTIISKDKSCKIIDQIRNTITNKRVIEIGSGVGILSFEMAKIAKSVIAIEADPAWSWMFVKYLYKHKPPNLTFIFGTAESVSDYISGDVAVIVTHSDRLGMQKIAKKLCPIVIEINLNNVQ
jgi:predicted RNA methylase